jgi:hypothetical protein
LHVVVHRPANGSRGTIVGIVLDPDEPIFDATSPAVTLKLTDYQSQGQTIESVIVDITTSNGQKLSHFNLYVALSRSSGRNTIRILRDFDEKLFAQSLDPDLLTDDERLEGLDAETKVWWETLKGESTAGI